MATSLCACVCFYFERTSLKNTVSCYVEVSLDVDADRDGVVEKNNPNKVSCDRSLSAAVTKEGPLLACKV